MRDCEDDSFRRSRMRCAPAGGRAGRCLAAALSWAALAAPAGAAPCAQVELPAEASPGALVRGCAPAGASVAVDGRSLRLAPDGGFVFGIGRDAQGDIAVQVTRHGDTSAHAIAVVPRDYRIERVDGLPPQTVTPDPAIAERIAREQARVVAARRRDDARLDWRGGFQQPVSGRISGEYGSQRILNGTPRSPHMGMDIAAPTGTPVKAPAPGVVTFADGGLYLTGGTVLLDHGHGLSSSFLHLSAVDVEVGQRVEQGQRIGAVGATGRASGPHLHWGLNWFDVRLDPALVLGSTP